MTVIVHAEDRSGRGDGYYTGHDLASVLDAIFGDGSEAFYADRDGEEQVTREDVAGTFDQQGETSFHNGDGDRFVITRGGAAV